VPRVAGIDPGTLTVDVCGLDGGRVVLDATWPTTTLLADPTPLLEALVGMGPLAIVVGPSGYGLPLRPVEAITDEELRLAFLAPAGERGGIGGLRTLTRRLASAGIPLVLTPGVIHLPSVPAHRKLNRVDLGTADKVCAAALAIADEMEREGVSPDRVSLLLLELGGAFTAGVAVAEGRIVDGLGGTSGSLGWTAAGALDAEVAFLAGEVSKATIFQGGVTTIVRHDPGLEPVALEAYVEGVARVARVLLSALPVPGDIIISGRMASDNSVRAAVQPLLEALGPVRTLGGFAAHAKQAAQGAALIADGLAGGPHRAMVERLGIQEARGTVLDHLHVIAPAAARRRLGLGDA
jgi:predicted butyrate kinase (DUF1464 family)